MKLVFVASEVSPFAKTGGLADVVGSLPKALKKLGHDVRIVMPFYQCVERGDFNIRKARKGFDVAVAGVSHKTFLRQASLDDIPVYFLEKKEFFQRPHLYGTPEGDYVDNARRFGFFCHGVLALLKRLDFRPDIIHCHDWQTALVPFLIKHEHQVDPFFMKTALVYTIHNLAYQGLFGQEALAELGLDPAYFSMDRLEFYGKINLMKGGILAADVVNTVSDTYCREIQTEALGCGLQGVLQQRGRDLYGIVNGIDYQEWDPAGDLHLFKQYTAKALAGKAANKKALQKVLGLEQAADVPLLAMVTRLSAQKGLDLLEQILPRLKNERLQLVLLGTGDEVYMNMLTEFAGQGADNISIQLDFNQTLARRIYAASDMFLMPSHYEPCGLGQLIAFRYGSVPVVRRTGGLADTVFDSRDGVREPNGFTFDEATADAFWEAISRARHAFADRKGWNKIVKTCMNADYSWEHSADDYEALYENALKKVHY
jgi:starch synthase